MTIVCGTDFSDNATEASMAAAALAWRRGEPLMLVHAMTGVPLVAADSASRAPYLERVRLEAAKLRDRFGIQVDASAVVGEPEEVLLEAARAGRASLVVVAALGTRHQRRWFLGSVAERLAQSSPVPVLIVRSASAILDWTHGRRSLSVMVGAALDSTSKQALAWAGGLRKVAECNISVVQIVSPCTEQARLGEPTLLAMDQLRPEVNELLLRDLRAWAGDAPGDGETTFLVSPGWGRRDTHLTLLAAEAESDLLVVGTHQRSSAARVWQGSTSRGVIHYAPSNVVCVPNDELALEEAPIPKFVNVLAPTDFSSLANRAIPVAYALVAPGGTVHLLNVVADTEQPEQSEARARLQALVPSAAAARGVRTELHVVPGSQAFLAIWQLAGRVGADAICMATHGRSGPSGVILGSQAHEVVRRARQPVLLVPPERD